MAEQLKFKWRYRMDTKSTRLEVGGLSFVCVPLADADFKDVAAIYVILCVDKDRSWKVLDVGQSGELGDRMDSHDRRMCWEQHCPGKSIWVCVHPMPTKQFTKVDRL